MVTTPRYVLLALVLCLFRSDTTAVKNEHQGTNVDNRAPRGTQDDYEIVWERIETKAMETSSHCGPSHILPLMQNDGSFSDLKYGKDGSKSFSTHGRRLSCLAYNHILNNGDYSNELTLGFKYMTYDAPPNTAPNWWDHVIGLPTTLWQGAVLAKDIIDSTILNDFLDRWWVKTGAGPVWAPDRHDDSMAGGNLAPRAYLAEVEGHIRGSPDQRHQSVKKAVRKELVLRDGWYGNGFRADGCLHQHCLKGNYTSEGRQWLNHTLQLPYAHNYGKEFIKWMSVLLTWYTGTSEDFEPAAVEGMYAAYLECTQWLFRGKSAEPTNAGRFITSGSMLTKWAAKDSILYTGENLLEIGLHHDEIEAALHRYENPVPDLKYALQGNRFFYSSDLMVQQQREYMAAVRILSNRTARPEVWVSSNRNKEGWFQADGFLTVLVDGGELGTPNAEVYQVFDWARVPGVTNLYTTDIPKYTTGSYWAPYFMNYEVFVGGVSDGKVGAAVMPYNRQKVPTAAIKSWFFFGDIIVALATGISLSKDHITGESVITTITQRLFRGSSYTVGSHSGSEVTISNDGIFEQTSVSWLHHDTIGYIFLGNNDQLLYTSSERKPHLSTDLHTFTAWLDHGSTPIDGSHAFAILPGVDATSTKDYAVNPDVEILNMDDRIHAVCHRQSQTIGSVFLKSGSLSINSCGGSNSWTLTVSDPCLALVKTKPGEVTVTLSEPTQFLESITFQLQVGGGTTTSHTVSMPDPPHRGSSVSTTITI